MKNKTATEMWNILKSEFDSVITRYVPTKKRRKQNDPRINICHKRISTRLYIDNMCGGFINIRDMIKIMGFTRRH